MDEALRQERGYLYTPQWPEPRQGDCVWVQHPQNSYKIKPEPRQGTVLKVELIHEEFFSGVRYEIKFDDGEIDVFLHYDLFWHRPKENEYCGHRTWETDCPYSKKPPYIPLTTSKCSVGKDGEWEISPTTYVGDRGEEYATLDDYYEAYPDRK